MAKGTGGTRATGSSSASASRTVAAPTEQDILKSLVNEARSMIKENKGGILRLQGATREVAEHYRDVVWDELKGKGYDFPEVHRNKDGFAIKVVPEVSVKRERFTALKR